MNLFRHFCVIAALLFIFPVANVKADVVDDFDTGATGTGVIGGSNGNWSAKWDGTNTTQRNLYSNVASVGEGGSNGLCLDVSIAERAYNAKNTTGVSVAAGVGNTMNLSSRFQYAHNGSLNNSNLPFIGLQLSAQSDWWNNSGNLDFTINRRNAAGSGNIIGMNTPGNGVDGWINETAFGMPGGGAAGTSSWFTMEILLTDNGTTYDAVYNLYDASGGLAHSESSATTFASGATLYGGFTTGWNNIGGAGNPITSITGVTETYMDDFAFTTNAVPEPGALGVLGFVALGMLTRRRRNA